MAYKPPLSFLLLLCCVACARLITDGADHVSDGVSPPLLLRLNGFGAADSSCDQTYGFLPCTTTVIGNLFLILVYGYLMYLAATNLSSGSELLLEILGPGIIGGLLLPILGALPDALLILVSGLSGTTATAQSQVSVGMGLLAGSTVMLLTIIWGTCVIVGKCDIQDSIAVDGKDTKGLSLTGSGVSTDIWTCYAARIMALSVFPFIVVQLPQAMSSTSGRHLAVLIGLIFSLAMLLSYCLYQILITCFHVLTLESDFDRLFHSVDADGDQHISPAELKALIIGIRFDEINLDHTEATEKLIKDFDTSFDRKIQLSEFIDGVSRWLDEAKRSGDSSNAGPNTVKYLDNFHQQTKREHDLLGDQSDEEVEGVQDRKKTTVKAVLLLLLGTSIAAAFADPLVDAVDNFSDATGIPTFFISFIVLPLATSSEAVSAIIFAGRKKRRTASLTFSLIYGAVTMNNALCLSVFLALVYVRDLTWDFSAEVLVIVIVCVVMGAFASFRTTFPLWTAILAFLLYPFSLALVYVLDYVLGWS
ncbi:hypothetical protein Vadar_007910 [Vaccinium darrowii]|uniref:Uncharacterized protein n=1 Tax=Vaccinium darrowii TaxID=229202 RepID=A0ACB7Z2T7_9ERIC|nr:hypothetical protein Vadar_007910 [Vaccinium darrowii]